MQDNVAVNNLENFGNTNWNIFSFSVFLVIGKEGRMTEESVKVVALDAYTAKNEGELNIYQGQTIKQKSPANEQGMAYGYIKIGKLGKKIYGFYPANLVVLKVKSQKTKAKKTKETLSETTSAELEETEMSKSCERTLPNFGVERTDSSERLSLRKIAFVYEELTESPSLNSKRLARMKVSPSISHRTINGLDKD